MKDCRAEYNDRKDSSGSIHGRSWNKFRGGFIGHQLNTYVPLRSSGRTTRSNYPLGKSCDIFQRFLKNMFSINRFDKGGGGLNNRQNFF